MQVRLSGGGFVLRPVSKPDTGPNAVHVIEHQQKLTSSTPTSEPPTPRTLHHKAAQHMPSQHTRTPSHNNSSTLHP